VDVQEKTVIKILTLLRSIGRKSLNVFVVVLFIFNTKYITKYSKGRVVIHCFCFPTLILSFRNALVQPLEKPCTSNLRRIRS